MRSLGGFVLLAGIGVGLFVYFPAPVDRNTSLEQATRAIETRAVESQVLAQAHLAPIVSPAPAPVASRLASFAPKTGLAAPRNRKQIAAAQAAAAASGAPAAKVETIANWQATVAPAGSGALVPTDADGRYKLVVDIQQELKRVGCYPGRMNGSWSASTREAMREFTSRANATLPVDKPDYLLLTLLRSHGGRSCGAPEATMAAAPAEVLPWKPAAANRQQAARLFTPVPTSVVTNEPLPGRMAIGGPRDFPPPAQQPLVPGTSSASQQGAVATAALEPGASAPPTFSPTPPAAAPKPHVSKKSSSFRRPSPGTPRYNLMLSLGGVY